MFGFGKGKIAAFSKRTILLLAPIPCLAAIINGSSPGIGFGNTFTMLLGDDWLNPPLITVPTLTRALTSRTLPSEITDFGTVYLYRPGGEDDFYEVDDDQEAYYIEQHAPLNSFIFGDEYLFKRASIEDASGGRNDLENSYDQDLKRHITDENFKFVKESDVVNNKVDLNNNGEKVFEKYKLSREDFYKSLPAKRGDLNLVIDLGIVLKGEDDHENHKLPIVSSIDLSQLMNSNSHEILFLTVDRNNHSDDSSSQESYFFKFEKDTASNSISLEIVKRAAPKANKARAKRSLSLVSDTDKDDSPVKEVSVRNFYVLFTENPPISLEGLFSDDTDSAGGSGGMSDYVFSGVRVRRSFLDNWSNSKNGLSRKDAPKKAAAAAKPTDDAKYEFEVKEGFWKSSCFDPYKVGGFIDKDLAEEKKKQDKELQEFYEEIQKKKSGKTFVAKQMSIYETFHPGRLKDIQGQGSWYSSNSPKFYPTVDYTTPTPCSDLDDETKNLFKKYAGINGNNNTNPKSFINETQRQIDVSKIPIPLKNLLKGIANTPESEKKNFKVVQGSFRAWGGDYLPKNRRDAKTEGLHNKQYEKAHQSLHTFSLKISKDILEKKLIEHQKLTLAVSQGIENKKLNELPEISSILQAYMPYSFSIYDPVSNYLKKQKVNLNIELDLKSLFNQNKFEKEFYIYDIGQNHKNIGVDYSGFATTKTEKQKTYGLSGSVNFSAGLFLDFEKNLNITLTANVQGFVNTKNPTCDLRDRKYLWQSKLKEANQENNNWSCSTEESWQRREHNHIPPFIVLEVDEDPKLTSYYTDRRIHNELQLTSAPAVQAAPEKKMIDTLSEFKEDLKSRNISVIHHLDQNNNGEVYFEKIDASDPKSKDEQEKKLRFSVADGQEVYTWGYGANPYYWTAYYYIPRRNEGSITIEETEKLKTVNIYLEGAASLAGLFFKSNHFNTVITKCFSSEDSSKVEKEKTDCADGIKYKNIEKDKKLSEGENSKLTDSATPTKITIPWSDLQQATQYSNAKKFNFQTIIHRKGVEDSNKADPNEFDKRKNYFEYVFTSDKSVSNHRAAWGSIQWVSLVGVWYTVDLWYESATKQIKYYTTVRPISVAGAATDQKGDVGNDRTAMAVGSSAKAGFQLSKLELEYESTPAKP
ncbi:hypothetical protein MHSWG343_10360 [Candidatus Mycoplasma haematohominis]|uniref:Rhodanese domain-containing protein n=1 Tax=Candidatus Mycoplasma haematohominis TaxID=1494318 RepID=A0A478FR10_9MOLU|nr:hypothetical protein MHSWG343_10360 [Candidatus Mycoplasma haemohominis]